LIALQNQYMIDTCRNIDILKQLINNSTKYALYIQHSSRKDIRFSRFTCTYQYIKHQNELSSIASQYTKWHNTMYIYMGSLIVEILLKLFAGS
jgi:hypothetical protein